MFLKAILTGVVIFSALIVQTSTGLFTGFRRDGSVRSVGIGWTELAREIETFRKSSGAQCVLGVDYGTTSWLMFYLPKGTCVVQRGDRYRWEGMPEPDANILKGKLLLVGFVQAAERFKNDFTRIEKLADVARKRSGTVIESYEINVAEGAVGDPLDRALPPELNN